MSELLEVFADSCLEDAFTFDCLEIFDLYNVEHCPSHVIGLDYQIWLDPLPKLLNALLSVYP